MRERIALWCCMILVRPRVTGRRLRLSTTSGRAHIRRDDLDPTILAWALSRQIDPDHLPRQRFVVQFEFTGVPAAFRRVRYWWLVLKRPEIDVCLKNPGFAVDVTIMADLEAFTRVWLGYAGLAEATRDRKVALTGSRTAVARVVDLLALSDEPQMRRFVLHDWDNASAASAG